MTSAMTRTIIFIERLNEQAQGLARGYLLEVTKLIQEIDSQFDVVLIRDQRTIFLSILFLSLLENGFRPVLLPPNIDLNQKTEFDNIFLQTNYVVIANGKLKTHGISDRSCLLNWDYGVFSSGTTGKNKFYSFQLQQGLDNAKAHAKSLNLGRDHVICQILPLSHLFGVIAYLFTPLVVESQIIMSDHYWNWNTLENINAKLVLHTTPFLLQHLLKRHKNLNHFDIISIGAGQVSTQVLKQLMGLYDNSLFTTYGLTEAGPRVSTQNVRDAGFKEGAIGTPIDKVALSLVDQEHNNIASSIGHLAINSPYASAEALTQFKNEKLVMTRDLFVLENGKYYFVARDSEVIKVRGVLVTPKEIRNILSCSNDVFLFALDENNYVLFAECENEKLLDLSALSSLIVKPKKTICLRPFPRNHLGKIDQEKMLTLARQYVEA